MNTKPQAEINTVLAAVTPTPKLSTDAIALDVMSALRGKGIGATSKPIMFSTPMVSAILDGRKTQTRRIIPESFNGCLTNGGPHPCPNEPIVFYPGEQFEFNGETITVDYPQVRAQFHCSTLDSEAKCKYGKPGDMLWVREKWTRYDNAYQGGYGYCHGEEPPPWPPYAEVNGRRMSVDFFQQYPKANLKWRPSIHMPKTAARIFLLNQKIWVEALHDISEEDALKEGVLFYDDEILKSRRFKDYFSDASEYGHPDHDYPTVSTAKESFASLWKSINGEESWNQNPWVWVIEFKLIAVKGVSIQIFNK